jgi:hypothetical protein
MRVPVQAVTEQVFDLRSAVLARWQADAVNDQQLGLAAGRAIVLVVGGALAEDCLMAV